MMRVTVTVAHDHAGHVARWTVSSQPEYQGEKWLPSRIFVLEPGSEPLEMSPHESRCDPRFKDSAERTLSYDEVVALLIKYPHFFFLDERESLRITAQDQMQRDALGRATNVLVPVRSSHDF